MTTQEMIFDYLKVQGLVPEYDEDKDIRFKYQMRNFVVSNYPDDRQFLQIMMPFIFDVTAENRVAALEACNKINLSKKIVKAVRAVTGGYQYVRAIALALEDRDGIVQVSMNLTNYEKTPIHRVFETIKSEASQYGVGVVDCDLVGPVPVYALQDVLKFYLRTHNFKIEQLYM